VVVYQVRDFIRLPKVTHGLSEDTMAMDQDASASILFYKKSKSVLPIGGPASVWSASVLEYVGASADDAVTYHVQT